MADELSRGSGAESSCFSVYKPDVTIAGGVFDIVRELSGKVKQEGPPNCFPYFKDEDLGICIDFYHRQQTTHSKKKLFGFLKDELAYHRYYLVSLLGQLFHYRGGPG